MARDSKLEVAAVNIRITDAKRRNYNSLLTALATMRRGVRVFGDSYVAISHFDSKSGLGIFSKYTEIDLDGDWFDLDDFDAADPGRLDEINVPATLKPNLAQFYFLLNEDLHVIAFSSYAESKTLSARSVQIYFSEILKAPHIAQAFGAVTSDIVKSYDEVTAILNLPELKELRLIIARPNADDIGRNLAKVIEERLAEQHGDEYEETLRAKGSNSLEPNQRTRDLATVAAENGQVTAKSLVNGVLVPCDTVDKPLIEVTKYKVEEGERTVFHRLAKALFARISGQRAQLK